MKKAMVVLSGGMDSSTLLAYVSTFREAHAITIDYGQRHAKEIRSAENVSALMAKSWKRRSVELDVPGSALTDEEVAVPHGHYEDKNMKLTVVPNRNAVLLSVAVAHAIPIGCVEVYYGAHSGDHAIYPDCRPGFVQAYQELVRLSDWQPPRVEAPFLNMNKADILRLGRALSVPYELTWTCYEGGELSCGKCGACTERLEAFAEAGLTDPPEYEN